MDEWARLVQLYRRLRSRYVANLVDSWREEGDDGSAFIVLQRGTAVLDEYLRTKRKARAKWRKRRVKLTPEPLEAVRIGILADICACCLHLLKHGFDFHSVDTSSFMYYTSSWRILLLGDASPMVKRSNPFLCPKPLVQPVMDAEFSLVERADGEAEPTLGSTLLELFRSDYSLAYLTVDELTSLEKASAAVTGDVPTAGGGGGGSSSKLMEEDEHKLASESKMAPVTPARRRLSVTRTKVESPSMRESKRGGTPMPPTPSPSPRSLRSPASPTVPPSEASVAVGEELDFAKPMKLILVDERIPRKSFPRRLRAMKDLVNTFLVHEDEDGKTPAGIIIRSY
eukprot:PLAT15160.1.p1 GENE.PLAT15160.1~~PLAT15160.1.p1  ORF type:complete len:385 (-),score=165.12 PLAT15160.1:101-1123(-)